MHYNRFLFLAVTCVCLLGCTSSVTHPGSIESLHAWSDAAEDAPYRIGRGDQLEIKFFLAPELNETVPVRPDGKISIMFAHNIQAAGKTPEELSDLIKKKIAPHVKESDLVVIMHSFASQKVYVGGEVSKPGPVTLTGRETLLQVIDEAGWTTPLAHDDEVVLVRKDENGKQQVYLLHTSDIMDGEDVSENIAMQAGDLVLVPPSGSVNFDRWIDRNIRQALPFSTNAGVIYTNQNLGGSSR